MRRFRVHTRNVFSLFMKFGVPQKGGVKEVPPLDTPLKTQEQIQVGGGVLWARITPPPPPYGTPKLQKEGKTSHMNAVRFST